MSKCLLFFCFIGTIFLLTACDDEKEEPIKTSSRIENLEEAKLIAESLDTLRKSLLVELDKHPPGDPPITIDFTLNGLGGTAAIAGTDSYFAVAGHTGGHYERNGIFTFSLDDYSNMEFIMLENNGEMNYQLKYNELKLCYPAPDCKNSTLTETLEISSSALLISMLSEGTQIEDTLEIKFSYEFLRTTQGDSLPDSTSSSTYFIKSSSGEIFEW